MWSFSASVLYLMVFEDEEVEENSATQSLYTLVPDCIQDSDNLITNVYD